MATITVIAPNNTSRSAESEAGYQPTQTLVTLAQERIEKMRSGDKLSAKGDKFSPLTINTWIYVAKVLNEFESQDGLFFPHTINQQWIQRYQSFLIKKNLAKNTIGHHLGKIKTLLFECDDQGLCSFNPRIIKTHKEKNQPVYTSLSDLQKLAAYPCTSKSLEMVKDMYIMQCFTGLRFSDLKRFMQNPSPYISQEHGVDYISINQKKVGTMVYIPIGRTIAYLLKKHREFKICSVQYYNSALKAIFKQAGFQRIMMKYITKGGIHQEYGLPVWTQVSSHTARRSFATNAYLSGIPPLSIMHITGHKDIHTFYNYIRCTALESTLKISGHDFFMLDVFASTNNPGEITPNKPTQMQQETGKLIYISYPGQKNMIAAS